MKEINKEMKLDLEALTMNHVIFYFEGADQRTRERFMFHLTHRYFPDGCFEPKREPIKIDYRDFPLDPP